jgi:hypothetical protein
MTDPAARVSSSDTPLRQEWIWRLTFLFCLAAAIAAISGRSFWIDEAYNGWKSSQPTFSAWWQEMVKWDGSDLQMPFYMSYAWVWEKVFGHSEWWLRAANLPWIALGSLAIPRRQVALLVVLAVSPFAWCYLDEARPYAMQLGATLLMLGALWHLAETPADGEGHETGANFWVWCFCFGFLALAGSSLLGVIWDAAALSSALAVLGWRRALRLGRRCAAAVVITALVLLALAPYYVWTLKQGARAAQIPGGMGNALFAGYEVAGLSGLGPGRLQIRSEGRLAVFAPFAIAIPLAVHAAMTGLVFLAGCRYAIRRTPRRLWLGVAAAVGGAAGLLVAAGFVTQFRVLGRHFAPLAVCVLLLLAAGLRALWGRGSLGRAAALVFLLLCAASAGSMRWAPRHAKDDYRGASAVAREALGRGERVWWCADQLAGCFYGLELSVTERADERGKAKPLLNPLAADLSGQPPPDLLVLSKVDLYDNTGAVREYLKQGNYRQAQTLPAFTFWRK